MSDDEKPQYIVTSPGAEDQPSPFATQLAAGLAAVRMSSTSSSKLVSSRSVSQSTRSHSLQSSSSSSSTVVAETSSNTVQSSSSSTSSIHKQLQQPSATQQQHKTLSSSNLASVTAAGSVYHTKVTKGKFQSFLQHPEDQASHHGTTFVTSHQKHHQFVRSSSAHAEGGNGTGVSAAGTGSIDFDTSIKKPDQFKRSSSTQIDEHSDQHAQQNQTHLLANASPKVGHHADHHSTGNLHREVSAILISKSAETIESRSSISSGAMRSQLTLSGGFLAPPNRKLTILSPIHAPPGLHEMLTRRHGRSPLSPRIGAFVGSEMDLFP